MQWEAPEVLRHLCRKAETCAASQHARNRQQHIGGTTHWCDRGAANISKVLTCSSAAMQWCDGQHATSISHRADSLYCNGSPLRPLHYIEQHAMSYAFSLPVACCMLVVAWCRLQNSAWDKRYHRTVRACTCAGDRECACVFGTGGRRG